MTDIVALTLNPSVDISTSLERLEPARKLRCSATRLYPGGGGVNVARVAGRLGAGVELVYPSGGSNGQLFRRLIEGEGIPSLGIDITEETRQDLTVLERSTGDEYRFVLPGPKVTEHEWQKFLEVLAGLLSHPKFVVASGSLPPGVPNDFYARVGKIVRKLKAKFVLDTSGAALRSALDTSIYLLKPNLRELNEYWGSELEDEGEIVDACQKIRRDHPIDVIVTSLGAKGALLVSSDGVWRAYSPPVRVVSTVGAGDSFLGAMVSGLTAGKSLADAFAQAVAAGTAAVLTPGTALCNSQDVSTMLRQVKLQRVKEPIKSSWA